MFLGLLHRLDKPVSGVMLFAKTSKAAGRISEQIRRRAVGKTYLAVSEGSPPPNGYLSHHLIKDRKTNTVSVADARTKGAKAAQLSFETLGSAGGTNLLKIRLITGRPHQIRVQLASEGYPVYGDKKYGKVRGTPIALHAWSLVFVHPTLKKEMEITAQPGNRLPWNHFKIPDSL